MIGGVLYRCFLDDIYCLLNVRNSTAIEGVVLGLFVFTALWWFRTRDVRQNIEQTNLFNGLQLLASDNPLKIDIGVHQLLRLSEAVPEYYPDIRIAFIRRLKISPIRPPKPEDGIRVSDIPEVRDVVPLAYAQHILEWLMKNEKNYDESDYENIDIFHQDFSKPSLFFDIQNYYKKEFVGRKLDGQSGKGYSQSERKGWKIDSVGVPESEIVDVKNNHYDICKRMATPNQYRSI